MNFGEFREEMNISLGPHLCLSAHFWEFWFQT